MGVLRTLAGVAVVGTAGILPLAPAAAQPPSGEALLRMMASCAGRYSATMEHIWVHNPSDADAVKDQRDLFVEILGAIVPPERGAAVLNWRIDAKAAHRALLTRSVRAKDAGEAEWARLQAEALLAQCDGAVLG